MNHKTLLLAGLALVVAACAPKSEMDKYIDDLMGRMTLQEKIGQLNLHTMPGLVTGAKLSSDDANVKALQAGQLGGVFGSSNTEAIRQMQEIAVSSG
ncbi:MAG: beta-glucosidase, partial [Bacteroidales bacterium]|nr:beta-glucosidase [Bacteroidales bacterium]